MSRQTRRQKAWSELTQAILHPPKRYKHQRDKRHRVKIAKLRKQV